MSTPGIIEAPLTETAAPATAPAPTAHKAGQEAPANWSGIASLALGVFSLVTAEFLPASLLTAIASDLHVSDGAAGQAVTATAIVGAVAAPSIPLLTRNIDRKRVVLMLSLLLLVSNILAVTAPNLPVLLVARVLLGVALGGFWSMAAALAMRLVPDHLFARAMSLILTGVSVATVCAAPIGAYMGNLWGWRSAFVAAGVVSLVAIAIQWIAIPRLPPKDHPSLKVLAELLGRKDVRVALLAVLLVVSGHFAGFTYIRPLMEQITHMSVTTISAVLLGYGVGGFFGNFAGGFIAERSERYAIVSGGALIALLAASLWVAGSSPVVAAVAITLWGFAFGAFPVGFQTWIVRAAPDHAEGAGGLLVAAFQVAIASGAIGGGVLVDHVGALGGPIFAVVAITLGTLLTLRYGPRGGGAPVAGNAHF
ncbi:MFS transporter [Herbaspirillum seropedicae]|uniref:Arabinose efflux permease protein n=1 Tax=Herbaspirillum seropedicae (strain SmR1) TaxID=757424 RepID=D8J134_HERSS|nr:MFS transporter [Herbaspirillum seropedicae]ADJ62589.1 arabinose efflux permease protein [Herbaspirillum seropedicae SmR1]AKN64700.1 transporter [Herbaspirillum seropedicae]MDR6396372.1 DHA1 family purine ribonucleoside efflux pump-like MFS transporter [Herbaspirillum seropedicae]NQE30879.1 transporter [Herbaspirillum seropedicae]UMU20640.1 MFS transporter [Herbaspirillum seropedicae]